MVLRATPVWIVVTLVGCGPLLTPVEGPNSPGFPPTIVQVEFTVLIAEDVGGPPPFSISEPAFEGSIDSVNSDESGVRLSGWAPVVGSAQLWIAGLAVVGEGTINVSSVARPDVASLVSPDFAGSGFIVEADGFAVLDPGGNVCIVAIQTRTATVLRGSDIELCDSGS